MKETNPFVESNIFKSVENVNLDTVIGYKAGGVRHHFLDTYDEKGRSADAGNQEKADEKNRQKSRRLFMGYETGRAYCRYVKRVGTGAGKIDGGIRLIIPVTPYGSIWGRLILWLREKILRSVSVRISVKAEATYLGPVKTEYHEGRIVQIPEERCQYVAEQMEYPELLVRLLACLKEGSLEKNTKFV